VLVLLPPSESKAAPPLRGAPVDLAALSFPELTPVREHLLTALERTSALPDAARRLLVGPSLAAEVERNLRIRELPTRRALDVYTGVLYDALDAGTLSTGAKRRARTRLVVVSALWGLVRPQDKIPPYRLNVCADLAGAGPLEPSWRAVLPRLLDPAAGDGLVVDCRSSSYLAMGMPSDADRTVLVRVLRDGAGGRSVVSHMAKHTRGLVARHLLERSADPRTPHALATALGERWEVELLAPPRAGRPWTVEVVVPGGPAPA
jgi:cytoplasmic iron level regulating protein YaaA (DUF328/UPF0246 family)